MNKDLAAGFQSWLEMWQTRVYALQRLRQAASRLRSPEVSTAFGVWVEHRIARLRAAQRKALEMASKTLEGQLRQAVFDSGQLEMVKVAQEDEIMALKEKLNAATESCRQKDAVLSKQQPLLDAYPGEIERLTELVRLSQEAAEAAERKRVEAEKDAIEQKDSNWELLQELLAKQRTQFNVDKEELEQKVAYEAAHRQQVEDELRSLKQQLSGAAVKLQLSANLQADLDQVRTELVHAKDEATKAKDESTQLQKELAKAVKDSKAKATAPKAASKVKQGVLGKIDLDEGADAPPISEQLATALRASSGKVLDLFREWDSDGDGEISRKEFHAAMPALGLEVPKEAIDELFNAWDNDGGGALEFKELQKILRPPPAAAKVGAIGKAAAVASAMKGKK